MPADISISAPPSAQTLPAPDVTAARDRSLDAVRGLAALSVVLCHYLNILTGLPLGTMLMSLAALPPLSLLVTGYGAVILFFVLSGYVLTLSLMRDSELGWGRFAASGFPIRSRSPSPSSSARSCWRGRKACRPGMRSAGVRRR
jgi:peptidoglycan/LPS O-acetylase OafA/YrhL